MKTGTFSCGLLSKTELTIFDTTYQFTAGYDDSCGLLSKTELTIFDTTTARGSTTGLRCGLLSKTELTIFDTTKPYWCHSQYKLWFAFKNRINDI